MLSGRIHVWDQRGQKKRSGCPAGLRRADERSQRRKGRGKALVDAETILEGFLATRSFRVQHHTLLDDFDVWIHLGGGRESVFGIVRERVSRVNPSPMAFGGARGIAAKAPEKGVFPLDHFGECKTVRIIPRRESKDLLLCVHVCVCN